MRKLSQQAKPYVAARKRGLNIQESYKLAGYKGKLTGTAPYEVEKRLQSLISGCRKDEILESVKEIALNALKSRKKQGLSKREELCIRLAFDLAKEEKLEGSGNQGDVIYSFGLSEDREKFIRENSLRVIL